MARIIFQKIGWLRFDRLRIAPLLLGLTLLPMFVACIQTVPTIPNSSASSGNATPTPTPVPGTPKTVQISWLASHSARVLTGGYKIYVKLNVVPTTSNTTPVTIANAAMTHTTSTSMTLSPGRYYVSVSSYSGTDESPLSTPYILSVP